MAQHTKNNHYIPKVLIRRFTNDTGERFYCEEGKISKKDAKKIFSFNEIYDDKLEKAFNRNESKLKEIFDNIDKKFNTKYCIPLREITIHQWDILVYNSDEEKEAIDILNTFFIRMNMKFYAASTNKNSKEVDITRDALTNSNVKGCENIVFIKYNYNFCPFVLPVNIPVMLPIGMSIVFVIPISEDTLMLYYTNKSIIESFVEKYPSKHHVNQAMIHINTADGRMLCNFVCSDKEYAKRLISNEQQSFL